MTDSNHRQDGPEQQDRESWRGLNRDTLDCELDAALEKFTAAEPRAGLENRILANLRVEQVRAAQHSWWRWPAVAALAAVIVVVFMAWRWGKPLREIAVHPPAATEINKHVGTQVANNGGSGTIRPHQASGIRLRPHAVIRPATVVASPPKLDQFPSPQPLSEQERILASYVTNFPEHASLIAQARTEALRQDSAEEMGEAASTGTENSPQWIK